MKEIVIQTFTILLMLSIIMTIILVRWEKELRQTFLHHEETGLKGVRVFVDNFETPKNYCRSSQPGDCNSTLFEQNRHLLDVSRLSTKRTNVEKLGNSSHLVVSSVSSNYLKQHVRNTTSHGQSFNTSGKHSLNVSKHPSGDSKRANGEQSGSSSGLSMSILSSNYSKHHVSNISGNQSTKTSDKHDVIHGADLRQNTSKKAFNVHGVSLEALKIEQAQKHVNTSHGFKPTSESYQRQKVAKTSNNRKPEAETEQLKFGDRRASKSESQNTVDVNGYTNTWLNDTMGLQRKGLKGFLIYDCSKDSKEKCGGWSDRLSGILSTLVLASLTNRTFKINFDNPCVLSEYLRPNQYNWTIGHSEYEGKSTSYHVLTNNLYHKMGKELTPKGLQEYFTSDFSFVRMNWDLTRQFRKYPNIQKYAPWITELHFSDIYFNLFNTLFKPTQEIVKELAYIRKSATKSKTACAHLRIGGNPSMRNDHPRNDKKSLKAVWSFLDQLYMDDYNIFVATDDDSVRKTAKERFENAFIDIPGSIMHIDQFSYRRGDVCEGFKKQLLDFLFLTTCDVLVLSNSGFGMMAAYLRTHRTGLFCWTHSGVVPCSRYTVHDFFPLPILAPEH